MKQASISSIFPAAKHASQQLTQDCTINLTTAAGNSQHAHSLATDSKKTATSTKNTPSLLLKRQNRRLGDDDGKLSQKKTQF